MHRTFETTGQVRLFVENDAGLVTITARESGTTAVSIEADTPGAEDLVERSVVECRPTGGGHLVVVKVPHARGSASSAGIP